MDLLSHLSDEHRALLALITQLQASAHAGDAKSLAERVMAAHDALTNELDTHIALEESVVFPVISGALGGGLVAAFSDEHREIQALRDDVLSRAGSGTMPSGPVEQLCDLIVAHQQREDQMLFPSARDALDTHELDALM